MKTDDDWVDVLAKLELFCDLPRKSLEPIASQIKEHRFSQGETIVAEDSGGALGRMYIVLEGTARADVDGQPISDYEPGDHFGEMSLLDGQPRSATVTATSDLVVAGLASWNLRAILMEHPSIAVHLIEVLAKRLRDANRGGA